MATNVNEVAGVINAAADQIVKATAEVVAALQNTPLPEAAQAALARLQSVVQALDDLNPDAPVPAPSPTSSDAGSEAPVVNDSASQS